MAKQVKSGISTGELNDIAEDLIQQAGAEPSFKNYEGYPASLCVSVNDHVVHGIPSRDKIIQSGDIVGLDLGIWYQGLCTDTAITIGVDHINKVAKKLIKVTRKSLELGIKQAKPGRTLGDIGATIQNYVEKNGFSVVKQLAGHGVGRQVHEDPRVLNFGQSGRGEILKPGMVIAIEPMVNVGGYQVETLDDQWTVATKDGSWSAHFEHTIAITERGNQILT